MRIDLRSDTVTVPDKEMRKVLSKVVVGDDAYQEDENVKSLENYSKNLFQMEDAVFVTSGMLANKLAVMSQTSSGDEVITEQNYHINFFDSGAYASIVGVCLNARQTIDGILTAEEVEKAISLKPRYYYFAQPKLVSIENTINGWAGKVFPFEKIKELREYTRPLGINIHLDGARIFNAHIATNVPLKQYAQQVDTLSFSFSKGLGAPFGSMLLGPKVIIDRARRYKIWLGGGVHQIGFNARMALYSLKHNIQRIREDHENTQFFMNILKKMDQIIINPSSGETNMIQFSLKGGINSDAFLEKCASYGLLLFPWLPGTLRVVIHKDITKNDLVKAGEVMGQVLKFMT